jgi:hypothetical protein
MADTTISEEWRIVEDWPDYEISSLGRLRRVTDGTNGTGGIIYRKGHIRAIQIHKGYRTASVSKNGITVTKNISVLVCTAFNGRKPSPDHEVAHFNGDRADDRADNLRWATRLENTADKDRHGRTPRGSRHWRTTLTEDQVLEIKARLVSGEMQSKIAKAYGVKQANIFNIKNGVSWGWLK